MAEIEINGGKLPRGFSEIDTGGVTLWEIWREYVEFCSVIPKEAGKRYLSDFEGKVPSKLIRQCMYAGMAYALQHPDKVRMV